MPKFPRGFGRRRSTPNELDVAQAIATTSEPSFKVFERQDGKSRSFDGIKKFAKYPPVPLRPESSTMDGENMFGSIHNRDSGASNSNTISTTDNSSRLSATSTAPSSTDLPQRDEWKSPHVKPFSDIPMPPVPKATSAFSLKNAGRTLSWGRHNQKAQTPPSPISKDPPSPSVDEEQLGRPSAVAPSSYASISTPPRLDERDQGLSLGGDFSDMYNDIGKRRSAVMDAEPNRAMSSLDAGPSGPADRSLSRSNQPSPLHIEGNQHIEPSPYSWGSQHSYEGLISSVSPVLATRNTPPPVPPHNTAPRTKNDIPASHSRPPRLSGPISGLRRSSALMEPKSQFTLECGDTVDEDARILRESISASRRMNEIGYESRVRDSWALPSDYSFRVDDATIASWGTGSVDATPKAQKSAATVSEDSMFDVHIAASANLAQRYNEKPSSPLIKHATPQNKVMTPAQFERYKQDQERLRGHGGHVKDEEEDEEDETYDDDEDEAEKNKQLAKQRRKQEAHMAIYRQQMMKVTGEALPSARPNIFGAQGSPNFAVNGDEGDEEDEEVPLAILQAHGFPNKSKQPMRVMASTSNPNLRSGAQSSAGGVVGSDSRLPVFAKNLPHDPYIGASLVNPMHRESLSFGGGALRGHAPGGLIGVIATEERSRAMRRGSPNPQGEYGEFNPMGPMGMQPPIGGSMYNGMSPGGQMMNPMMMTPGDHAQIQMSQQMQQFMQMQMQFMQIMTAGTQAPPQNGHMPRQSMGEIPRPGSAQKMRPGSSHNLTYQRSISMLDPNSVPWIQGGGGSMYSPSINVQGDGYAPSIAPSERSNVGLPERYRPVSQAPPQVQDKKTKAPTMFTLGWENNKTVPAIGMVKKPANVSDEDDDEGWEEMVKKREKKKSLWRTKRDLEQNGLKEVMGFAQ